MADSDESGDSSGSESAPPQKPTTVKKSTVPVPTSHQKTTSTPLQAVAKSTAAPVKPSKPFSSSSHAEVPKSSQKSGQETSKDERHKQAKKDAKAAQDQEKIQYIDETLGRASGKPKPKSVPVIAAPAASDDEEDEVESAPSEPSAGRKRKAEESPEKGEKKKRKKKKKSKKDPDAPKHPQSAYLLFSNSVRAELKEEYPGISPKDLMSRAGERWKNLGEEERQPWKVLASDEMQKYQQLKAEYKERKEEHEEESAEAGNGQVKMEMVAPTHVSFPVLHRPDGKRVLLVREKGNSHYRRIGLARDSTFAFLAKRLKKKLENKHDIKIIIQGGKVAVKDNEDVELLDDLAELEVSFRSGE